MSQQSDLWDWLKDQPPRNFTFREAAKEIGTDEVAVRKALAAMSSRNIKEPGPLYPGLLRDFRHSGAYCWMGKNARLDAFLADVVGVLSDSIVVRDVNGQVFTVKPIA